MNRDDNSPTVADVFAGVGGMSVGLSRAGLRVAAAVDIAPQPDYPFPDVLVKGDALAFLRGVLSGRHLLRVDPIHASAPCQFDAAITRGTNAHLRHRYADLYEPTRELLEAIRERHGIPYSIETPRARRDAQLCGEMFGLRVTRHRNFELGGWSTDWDRKRDHVPHKGLTLGMRHGKLVTEENGGHYFAVYGNGGYKGTVVQWKNAMGIDWTDNRKSLAEAVPPAYGEWIGRRFIEWKQRQTA